VGAGWARAGCWEASAGGRPGGTTPGGRTRLVEKAVCFAYTRTGRTRVEKGVDLLLKEVSLDGAEELFGLRQGQPKMLDALLVLVEGDDIGDGLFLTLIVTDDELQFDTHTGASPGSSDG
jgi:hypothetical protein